MQRFLSDGESRIHAIALVHEWLYRSEGQATVNLSQYVGRLARHIMASHRGAAKGIRFKCEITPTDLGLDEAVACGLILNEVLTNALMHAFRGMEDGEILVAGGEDCGLLTLTVTDNGIGLPNMIDPKTTTSLGLQLVHSLADQLRGELTVDSATGKGTRITLCVPR